MEKKLGARGTGQNWNTVLKLDELLRKERLAPQSDSTADEIGSIFQG
jgi:hypothetical protein